jgi:hypothetical protein
MQWKNKFSVLKVSIQFTRYDSLGLVWEENAMELVEEFPL